MCEEGMNGGDSFMPEELNYLECLMKGELPFDIWNAWKMIRQSFIDAILSLKKDDESAFIAQALEMIEMHIMPVETAFQIMFDHLSEMELEGTAFVAAELVRKFYLSYFKVEGFE